MSAEVIQQDAVRVVVPDPNHPDLPDVFDAVVEDNPWDNELSFRVDASNLVIYASSIPHYIELFEGMQKYVEDHKEEK